MLQALIEQIKQLAKDASMMVDMAKDMLDEGRRFLLDADKAYKVYNNHLQSFLYTFITSISVCAYTLICHVR